MNRRTFVTASAGMLTTALATAQTDSAQQSNITQPNQRLGQKYHFDDPDMDLFFMAALGWGPAGGLDVGQAFYVASTIKDGDADSWVHSFANYGDQQNEQARAWKQRGWKRAAGEARLKAFASYRSAWQFAAPGGDDFKSLYAKHKQAFAAAMEELAMPASFFQTPYAGKQLPGVFLKHPVQDAPVVLIIGGADTCFEDLFLTVGRNVFERGYSVALVDLPGQGITAVDGLYWEAEAEKPIAAIIDILIDHFQAKPGKIALMGLSLGGYFVTRAAGYENRLATVIASTPFPRPGEMFVAAVKAAANSAHVTPTPAAMRSRQTSLWKAGAKTPQEFIARSAAMIADPAKVTVPFLSILGSGDSPVFAAQSKTWHRDIRSTRKDFVLLDKTTGADGHVQVNNRLRLAQESCGWLDEIFAG